MPTNLDILRDEIHRKLSEMKPLYLKEEELYPCYFESSYAILEVPVTRQEFFDVVRKQPVASHYNVRILRRLRRQSAKRSQR